MYRFLVTGGAGFIGSNTVEELLKQGNKDRILDNFETDKLENISDLLEDIEVIEGDIRSLEAVRKASKDVDYVIHPAALGSVQRSV